MDKDMNEGLIIESNKSLPCLLVNSEESDNKRWYVVGHEKLLGEA